MKSLYCCQLLAVMTVFGGIVLEESAGTRVRQLRIVILVPGAMPELAGPGGRPKELAGLIATAEFDV
jgi:hypothetical protein